MFAFLLGSVTSCITLCADMLHAQGTSQGAAQIVQHICRQHQSHGCQWGFVSLLRLCVQWARSVSSIKLLEESDPLYAWRARVFDLFKQDLAETEGYPLTK